jgi:hypothetical protein
MIFGKSLRKSIKLMAILLAVFATAAAVATAAPQKALAAGCGVQSTSPSGAATDVYLSADLTCDNISVAHKCVTMGGNNGIFALECADIYVSYTPDSFDVYGVGEYYCQGPDGYARCDSMSVDQVLLTDTGEYGHPGGNYTCSGSSCAAARATVDTYHYTGSLVTSAGACIPEGMITQDLGTNSITVPTLPEGTTITYPSGMVSGGVWVCFQ